MANDKIMKVSLEILRVMMDTFPREHLEFIFGGILEPGDIVEMAMLELIKKAYEKTEEKHSLRYFYEKNGITEMDEIMRYSRLQSFVMKWRKKEYERRILDPGYEFLNEMDELLPPDMSDMKTRLSGYQLTEMNFFELNIMLENEFTKAFTEKRLIDSKKISNVHFKEIMQEFDDGISKLREGWLQSTEDIVFSSLAAYTLEWKYPVNFLYVVAKKMEEKGLRDFPDAKARLASFCADIHFESMLNYKCSTHSRMLTVRERYIEIMLEEPEESLLFEAEQLSFIEGLGIVVQLINNMTIDNIPIQEWFIKYTNKEDWASFFIDYDLFVHIGEEEKNWTNKTIRYFRECLSLVLLP